eukprot:11274591-Alexandrium_andersonii.AAC.1
MRVAEAETCLLKLSEAAFPSELASCGCLEARKALPATLESALRGRHGEFCANCWGDSLTVGK